MWQFNTVNPLKSSYHDLSSHQVISPITHIHLTHVKTLPCEIPIISFINDKKHLPHANVRLTNFSQLCIYNTGLINDKDTNDQTNKHRP